MEPCSLQRAAAWRISRVLINKVWRLDITKESHRERLVGVLQWIGEDEYRCVCYPILQNEIHTALMGKIRYQRNPPVYLTCMLTLCPQVTVDLINRFALVVPDTDGINDLTIDSASSSGMLQVVDEFLKRQSVWRESQKGKDGGQEGRPNTREREDSDTEKGYHNEKELDDTERNVKKRENSADAAKEETEARQDKDGEENGDKGEGRTDKDKPPPLPLLTKTLVLEDVCFLDQDFLPKLVERMPHLKQISLQYNITPCVMRALSQHCRRLESLRFLEQDHEMHIDEGDIIPLLFGVPPGLVTTNLHHRFVYEGEDFRKMFVPQFPHLRVLDIEEMFMHTTILDTVYILALFLQPKLESLGQLLFLSLNDILVTYCMLWKQIHGTLSLPPTLPLTYARFNDEIYVLHSETDWQDWLQFLGNLTCVELVMNHNRLDEMVGRVTKAFRTTRVRTFSVCTVPFSNMDSFHYLHHLRITLAAHYPFDTIHTILDSCPCLTTLSFHPMLYHPPESPHLSRQLQEIPFNDEDRLVMEELLRADVMNNMVDQMLAVADNQEAANEGLHGGEGVRRTSLLHKKNYTPHTKLTTLRLASLCKARQEPTESFLMSLMLRLPHLHQLCLGSWMSCLAQYQTVTTCTATALVSVLTRTNVDGTPHFTELKQLCCLPSTGLDGEQACHSLLTLVHTLPSLRCIVLPVLDPPLLSAIHRHFRHAHIELRNKCDTERVFTFWDPEH